jgi:hypothetical protein
MQNNFLWVLLLLVFGCNRSDVSTEGYMAAWQKTKNSVSVSSKNNAIEMTLTYLPSEFLVINDIGLNMKQRDYDKSLENFCDHIYCTLKIKNTASASKQNAIDIPKYFARDRQRQIFGIHGTDDTLRCVMYQPELIGNKSIETTVNVVFNRPLNQKCGMPLENDFTCLFKMSDSTNSDIKLTISKNAINQLPKLKF